MVQNNIGIARLPGYMHDLEVVMEEKEISLNELFARVQREHEADLEKRAAKNSKKKNEKE